MVARGAREGLWLEQNSFEKQMPFCQASKTAFRSLCARPMGRYIRVCERCRGDTRPARRAARSLRFSPSEVTLKRYKTLLSLHDPVARAARALAGRYTASEATATVRILSHARAQIYWFSNRRLDEYHPSISRSRDSTLRGNDFFMFLLPCLSCTSIPGISL